MGSLITSNDCFFDPHRKKWVKKRPEELIRHALVHTMTQTLGYPLGLIAQEKELSKLPHLSPAARAAVPKRRIDIVVFAPHPTLALFPLLLIECKATPLTPDFANQIYGYNEIVRSPFIALANGEKILMGHYQEGKYHFTEGLLSYSELLAGRGKRGSVTVTKGVSRSVPQSL